MTIKRVAIIGSGIAGLSAAWLLSRSSEVTLFEKADRLGGHANTVTVDTPDGRVAVDTGFIVYNEKNYPNLCALYDHLGVATSPTCMSFAVSVDRGRMEYCGRNLGGLFGQRRNIVRMEHWQLVSDILRFFRNAEQQADGIDETMSIGDFLKLHGYSRVFIEDHLLPISAAIWSTPTTAMLDFPARTFISFFANHGLLQITDRPKWRTVTGGSQAYVEKLVEDCAFETVFDAGLVRVLRRAGGVELVDRTGARRQFDEVVFACHADEALALLGDPTEEERRLLGAFRYTRNRAVLHTDATLMPKRRHLWSSWNYLRTAQSGDTNLSLTYWMNQLQPLPTKTNLFVTLNPGHAFAPGTVHYEVDYDHPLFDAGAVAAQHDMWRIQGHMGTWFAGAWLGQGFHEDGLQSGLEVAERIGGVARPWRVGGSRGRIAHNWAEEEPMETLPTLLAAE